MKMCCFLLLLLLAVTRPVTSAEGDASGEPVVRAKSAVGAELDGVDEDGEKPVKPRLSYAPECPPEVACNAGELCIMHAGFPSCYDPNSACHYLPCENGGSCFNLRCTCLPGYTGPLCQHELPKCPLGYCLNGGSCTYDSYTYLFSCACLAGFRGQRCEISPPDAPSCNLLCYNQGSCVLDPFSIPRCVCQAGYTGDRCQISNCNLVCQNGGVCYKDLYGQQRCRCSSPWVGPTCGTLSPPNDAICNNVNCEGDCVCQESCRHANGYVCASTAGFLGRHCTIPVPDLQCTSNEIIITVSQQFYAEWDANQANTIIYMSPTVDGVGSTLPQCRAQLVGSTYRISMSHPYTQCGTQTSSDVGPDGFNSVSFTNALWINKNFGSTGFSYDLPFGIIRFRCIYANSYTIYTSIKPLMDEPPILTDDLQYQVSATLCKVSTCNSACPASLTVQQSAVYTVGQMIHLDFGLSQFSSAVINLPTRASAFIQYVTLSCSPSSSSNTFGLDPLAPQNSQFPLFQNGCPTEHGRALAAEMGASTLDHRACFSFRLPRSKVCSELYIHVRLHVCTGVFLQSTCPDGFSSGSTCSTNRRKRSVDEATTTRPFVIGPIYTLPEEEGEDQLTFLIDGKSLEVKPRNRNFTELYKVKIPNPKPPREYIPPSTTTKMSPGLGMTLFATAICVSLVILSLAAVLLILRRRQLKPDGLGF